MGAENGIPAEVKRDGTYCPNCDMKGSTYHGALRILRCGSIPTDDNKHLNEVSPLCEARKRISELEAENGELRTQVSDFKSSDEGHVRAREMDEAQIKDLHAENKSYIHLIRTARQILMTCNIERQRQIWIDARKAWLNIFDNNFRGVQ